VLAMVRSFRLLRQRTGKDASSSRSRDAEPNPMNGAYQSGSHRNSGKNRWRLSPALDGFCGPPAGLWWPDWGPFWWPDITAPLRPKVASPAMPPKRWCRLTWYGPKPTVSPCTCRGLAPFNHSTP
jgi:hypothetical protein